MTRIQFSVTRLDQANHGKEYSHSGFCDLVISGLCSVEPGGGEANLIEPFAPLEWNGFCLKDFFCESKRITGIRIEMGIAVISESGSLFTVTGKSSTIPKP